MQTTLGVDRSPFSLWAPGVESSPQLLVEGNVITPLSNHNVGQASVPATSLY